MVVYMKLSELVRAGSLRLERGEAQRGAGENIIEILRETGSRRQGPRSHRSSDHELIPTLSVTLSPLSFWPLQKDVISRRLRTLFRLTPSIPFLCSTEPLILDAGLLLPSPSSYSLPGVVLGFLFSSYTRYQLKEWHISSLYYFLGWLPHFNCKVNCIVLKLVCKPVY